jgi:DNA-binding NtrC family response regulator
LIARPQESSRLEHLPLGGQSLASLENAAIRQTLAKHGGNRAQAAQALGISVSTLYEKLKKLEDK